MAVVRLVWSRAGHSLQQHHADLTMHTIRMLYGATKDQHPCRMRTVLRAYRPHRCGATKTVRRSGTS